MFILNPQRSRKNPNPLETHMKQNALFWRALMQLEDCPSKAFEIIDILEKSYDSNPNVPQIDVDDLIYDYEHKTPLSVSIETGNTKLVEALLKYGADCNKVRPYIGYDTNGNPMDLHWVPLTGALELKDSGFEMLELLLRFGANPNVILPNGTTLLHTLSRTVFVPDNVKRLHLLLAHIAPSKLSHLLNLHEETDTTIVLINAIQSLISRDTSFLPIVHILLKTASIELEAQSKYGLTPMAYCITHMTNDQYTPGCKDVLETLLMHGAKTETRFGTKRETALHVAVKLRKYWAVWILLKAGADQHAPDMNGVTPLQLAQNQPLGEYPRAINVFEVFDAKMKICNDQCFAYAMGHHNRLGESSWVSNLDPNLTHMIARFARNNI
jgi:ankyrin repeat protein